MLSKHPVKIVSFTNFNPVALFSLFLLLIGLILGAVGTGLDQWSQIRTERRDPENVLVDGGTSKTQGLLRRCVDYDLTAEIELLGLPSEELPSSRCLAMSDLNCSLARVPLFSALDILGHDEVQNSDEVENCDNMKTNLEVVSAFMILGVIATFVALVLYFPLWHWVVFIFGAGAAVASVIFLAIALGVFVDLDKDFAGFFSIEGQAADGCLSYGFGISLAAFIVNVIATVVGIVAIFYKTFAAKQRSKHD